MSTRWYRTGTVTVTQGSTIVTGVDTQWTSQTVAGDLFTFDGSKIYEVASIESNTSLTLGSAITESSGSGLSYGIARNVNGRTTAELAGGVALLIEEYEGLADSAGGGKFSDGSVSAPGITFADDLNTGMYRIGTDNIGIACNATKILDIGTTGVAVGAATGGKKAAGTVNATGYYLNGTDISAATTSAAGLMAAADKTKLNGIATSANNYTHPATHAPSVIAQDASNRFVTDTEKSTWNAKASTAVATTSAAGLMSATDKTKLEGVDTGANNYTHPATHAPSVIAQDASNRFVTDTEKSTWNAKAAGSHTHTLSAISDLDTWITITGWTRTANDTFTYGTALSMLTALRYRIGTGAWKYGVVVSRSGSTYTIAGEALLSTVTEVQIDWTGLKTAMLYFYAPGAFAPAVAAANLSDQRGGTTWMETAVYPRFMRTRCKTAYGGATPYVNLALNNNNVFGDNSGNGIEVTASAWSVTGVSISEVGPLYYGQIYPLIVRMTVAGSGSAGSDMWVEVACVKA